MTPHQQSLLPNSLLPVPPCILCSGTGWISRSVMRKGVELDCSERCECKAFYKLDTPVPSKKVTSPRAAAVASSVRTVLVDHKMLASGERG